MAADNDYSLGSVPNTARKGVASLTMVMLGHMDAGLMGGREGWVKTREAHGGTNCATRQNCQENDKR